MDNILEFSSRVLTHAMRGLEGDGLHVFFIRILGFLPLSLWIVTGQ
jgi:hypothetical protein